MDTIFRSALVHGVGLFCAFATFAAAAASPNGNSETTEGPEPEPEPERLLRLSLPELSLPEVTFFWQRERFGRDHRVERGDEPPSIPQPEERIALDEERRDPALWPAEEIGLDRFVGRHLLPLESFLEPTESASDGPVLELDFALFHALSANPSLVVRDLQGLIERERVLQAESAFIPVIELSADASRSRFPQNAAEASSTNLAPREGEPRVFFSRNEALKAALLGETPHATQYELYTNLTINESTLTRSSLSALYREEYSTNVGLRVTQPILQGGTRAVREAPIRIARLGTQIAEAELRSELNEIALGTLEAYFEFVEAGMMHDLRHWEERIYRELGERVQSLVEVGDASSRDLLRLAIRQGRLADRTLQADEQFRLARLRLLERFGPGFPTDAWVEAVPSGALSASRPAFETSAIIESAVARSSRIAAARLEYERRRESVFLARDEARPSLNLIGGVEMRGLGDDPYNSFYYGTSNQRLGFNVGVVYSRPWDNTAAESKIREARAALRQAEYELRDAENNLRTRISTEALRLDTIARRHHNLADLVEHLGQEIDEEMLRLETGETSVSAILEFYEDLLQIKMQSVALLRDLNFAKARLWAAEETLLSRLGIDYSGI